MPEGLEVEQYRQAAAAVLRVDIVTVVADDPWYLKDGLASAAVRSALVGRRILSARRIGKLLLLDTSGDRAGAGGGPTLGLRFGMTGRLMVDQAGPIDRLAYGSRRDEPEWDRFVIGFADGRVLRLQDPRRLGGVQLDPDEAALGPDVFSLGLAGLRRVLAGSEAPLKARLMDQGRVAGLGNLLTDEILWRAGLDPRRPAGNLDDAERRRLHRQLRRTLVELGERGGSHTGDLQAERHRLGRCPRDGAELQRLTVGGRTTYACPLHQLDA